MSHTRQSAGKRRSWLSALALVALVTALAGTACSRGLDQDYLDKLSQRLATDSHVAPLSDEQIDRLARQ